jgi:hypothetical protein
MGVRWAGVVEAPLRRRHGGTHEIISARMAAEQNQSIVLDFTPLAEDPPRSGDRFA